jgi:hypothetical protein
MVNASNAQLNAKPAQDLLLIAQVVLVTLNIPMENVNTTVSQMNIFPFQQSDALNVSKDAKNVFQTRNVLLANLITL